MDFVPVRMFMKYLDRQVGQTKLLFLRKNSKCKILFCQALFVFLLMS